MYLGKEINEDGSHTTGRLHFQGETVRLTYYLVDDEE